MPSSPRSPRLSGGGAPPPFPSLDTLPRELLLEVLGSLPLDAAARCTALALGRLELPPALLATPQHAAPYLTAWALAPEGSGGATMRSRNNIQRGGNA